MSDSLPYKILEWHQEIDRHLPWKETKDPYFIWLSEIILQQTRVAQGLPYYEKFITTFPTIHDLAAAPEDQVMQCWQGLGYYSRARNLHATAKRISTDFKGVFPNTYEEILDLKGVGPYTAAAIASFAFDIPKAVVDGNVLRVYTRYHGIQEPIDDNRIVKEIRIQLDKVIIQHEPASFNQAIMDFGAMQCTPAKPGCNSCVLQENCVAYNTQQVASIPFKKKKLKKKHRYFHYLHIEQEGNIAVQKRVAKDIWQSLYELPMIETDSARVLKKEEIQKNLVEKYDLTANIESNLSYDATQLLSHQKIHALIYKIESKQPISIAAPLIWQSTRQLGVWAFPRLLDKYLQIIYLPPKLNSD